jgi:A118 family predicted phage portal protein
VSVLSTLKNWFRKGGASLGMIKSLTLVTDDRRIAMDPGEYTRINVAKKYYSDDFRPIEFINSYGDKRMRKYESVNVTKLAARRLASIIFNERCKVEIGDDEKANELLESVFLDNEFYLTFEEYLEKWIALGSGAIRPYVQGDKIKLAWVTADQFYPLHVNTNEVKEAAIASKSTIIEDDKNVYYTLLEFHEWQGNDYVITNELYRSENADSVGVQVPLSSLEEYANTQETATLTGLVRPLFAFFKTPGANNKMLESPLGLGLIDNSRSTVDAINRTHDEFIWDVRSGKRRIVVPKSWLKRPNVNARRRDNDTHPPMFDPDETVYQAMYGDDVNIGFHDMSVAIRVDQYSSTMEFFLHEFENEIGLSQGTFTQSASGVQTATEVVSNNSMTYQTRSSYLTMVEKTITQLVDAILELAQCGELFSDGKARWTGDVQKININIDFNDGVFIDQDAQLKNDLQALQASALPIKQFLMRNYSLDEATADEWVQQLEEEKASSEPAPSGEVGLFGGADDGNRTDVGESGQDS